MKLGFLIMAFPVFITQWSSAILPSASFNVSQRLMPAVSNGRSPTVVAPSTGRPQQSPTAGPRPSPAQGRKGDATSRTFASASIPKSISTPPAARPGGASHSNVTPTRTPANLSPVKTNTFGSQHSSGPGSPGRQPSTSPAHTSSLSPSRSVKNQSIVHSSFSQPAPITVTTKKQSTHFTVSNSQRKTQTSFTPSPHFPSPSSQTNTQSFPGHAHSVSVPASSTLKSSITQPHGSDTRTAVQTSSATITLSSVTNSLSSGTVPTPFHHTTSFQSSSDSQRRQSTTTFSTTSLFSSSTSTTLGHTLTTTPGFSLTSPNSTGAHFDTSTSLTFGSIPHIQSGSFQQTKTSSTSTIISGGQTTSRTGITFSSPDHGHSVPKHGSMTSTLFGTTLSPIAASSNKHNSFSSSTTTHISQTTSKSQNSSQPTSVPMEKILSPFSSHGQSSPTTSAFGTTSKNHRFGLPPTHSTPSRGQVPSQTTTTTTLKTSTSSHGQGPSTSTHLGITSSPEVTGSSRGHKHSFSSSTATHVQTTEKNQNPSQLPSRTTPANPSFTTNSNHGQDPSTSSLRSGKTTSSNTSSSANGHKNNTTSTKAHNSTPSKGNSSHSTATLSNGGQGRSTTSPHFTTTSSSQASSFSNGHNNDPNPTKGHGSTQSKGSPFHSSVSTVSQSPGITQTLPTTLNQPGNSQTQPSPGHQGSSSTVSSNQSSNLPPKSTSKPAQPSKQSPPQGPASSQPASTSHAVTSEPLPQHTTKSDKPHSTRTQNSNSQNPATDLSTSGDRTGQTGSTNSQHSPQTTAKESQKSTITLTSSIEISSQSNFTTSSTSWNNSLTGTTTATSITTSSTAPLKGPPPRVFDHNSEPSSYQPTSTPITHNSSGDSPSSLITHAENTDSGTPKFSSSPISTGVPPINGTTNSSRNADAGVIAGSTIASVIAAVIIAVIAFLFCRRKRHRQRVTYNLPASNRQLSEASGISHSPAPSADGGQLYNLPVHMLPKTNEDIIRPSFFSGVSTMQNTNTVGLNESPHSPTYMSKSAAYLDNDASDDEGTMYGYQQSKRSSRVTSDYVSVQEHLPDDMTELATSRIQSFNSNNTAESNVEYGFAL